jgi:hypothetical protein
VCRNRSKDNDRVVWCIRPCNRRADAVEPTFGSNLTVAVPPWHTQRPASSAYVTEQTASPFAAKVTLGQGYGNCRGEGSFARARRISMLYTIAIVLVVLWLLGLVTSYTMGGFLHILLVLAVIMILVQIIQGRRI